MSPKEHTRKVTDEATRKKNESPYQCSNCGKTFVSESECKSHEEKEHPRKPKQRTG